MPKRPNILFCMCDELRAFELKEGAMKIAWTRKVARGSWHSTSRLGPFLLRKENLDNDQWRYAVFDGRTGAEVYEKILRNPTFWYQRGKGGNFAFIDLEDPFLVVVTSLGVHVYRRVR